MKEIKVVTKKKYEMVDITEQIEKAVKGVEEGTVLVYVPHATAAIVINENYDPNVCLDILDALDDMIPEGKWKHDKVDGNGAAHIKAAILGPSETMPIKDGKLQLGTWQSPMLVELDGPRERKIILTITK